MNDRPPTLPKKEITQNFAKHKKQMTESMEQSECGNHFVLFLGPAS